MEFIKYHGHGNDFLLIDEREKDYQLNAKTIRSLCHRRYGVGADGLILVRLNQTKLEMVYFNADGHLGSMCGNAGRCFAHYVTEQRIRLPHTPFTFLSCENQYQAKVLNNAQVELAFPPIAKDKLRFEKQDCFLDTGSPHHVKFVTDVENYPVEDKGKKIRWSSKYAPEGTNVNFVEIISKNRLKMRTYERGVEMETLACGTGTVASVLLAYQGKHLDSKQVKIQAIGGHLEVDFEETPTHYTAILFRGRVHQVFQGKVNLNQLK